MRALLVLALLAGLVLAPQQDDRDLGSGDTGAAGGCAPSPTAPDSAEADSVGA